MLSAQQVDKQKREILEKVKKIDLAVKNSVDSHFFGNYKSVFRGQGVSFSEFRPYIPGDEVRFISWPLFARTGKLYVKQFDEERDLNVVIVFDVSKSVQAGTLSSKREEMTFIASIFRLQCY